MTRLLAFSCFLCAAFAWVPPGLDRAGTAALGAAFLSWSVGRGFGWFARRERARPPLAELADLIGPAAEPEAETELRDRIGAYSG